MPKLGKNRSSVLNCVGAKEILGQLALRNPRKFKDLYEMQIGDERVFRTTTTISNRLRELLSLGLIEKDIKNNPGRVLIQYIITPAGVDVLRHLQEIDRIVSDSISKKTETLVH